MSIYVPDLFRGRTICDVVEAEHARSRRNTVIAYSVLAVVALIGPSAACAIVQYCMGF